MEKSNLFDEQLLSEDEREQVEYMWDVIPEQDRKSLSKGDIVFVLDAMDDYLEEEAVLPAFLRRTSSTNLIPLPL